MSDCPGTGTLLGRHRCGVAAADFQSHNMEMSTLAVLSILCIRELNGGRRHLLWPLSRPLLAPCDHCRAVDDDSWWETRCRVAALLDSAPSRLHLGILGVSRSSGAGSRGLARALEPVPRQNPPTQQKHNSSASFYGVGVFVCFATCRMWFLIIPVAQLLTFQMKVRICRPSLGDEDAVGEESYLWGASHPTALPEQHHQRSPASGDLFTSVLQLDQ